MDTTYIINTQVNVVYEATPPQVFISDMRKFVAEHQPPGYRVQLTFREEKPSPSQPARKRCRRGVQKKRLVYVHLIVNVYTALGAPKGYTSVDVYPTLGGEDPCPYCHCTPCVIRQPPDFLSGSSAPHACNRQKRFKLYQKFWRLMEDLGEWRDPTYLKRKKQKTAVEDPREIFPQCILDVSKMHAINVNFDAIISNAGGQTTLPQSRG